MPTSFIRTRRGQTVGLLALFTLSAAAAYTLWPSPAAPDTAAALCPAGYDYLHPFEVAERAHLVLTEARKAELIAQFGNEPRCTDRLLLKRLAKKNSKRFATPGSGKGLPPRTLRAAVDAKAEMQALQKVVANADGEWQPYGIGNQIGKEEFPDGARDGIPKVAGRVDKFAYDPVARRLFASVGNGGVWMSEAVDGDVATLGDNWVSIGDGLPSQVTSAVAWTPAGGGRVIALTGEHTQGGNSYVGLGAYWSDDLGQTWNHAAGVPDEALAFNLAVDESRPEIVYAATGKGLFRSEDAGETYTNVALPVSEQCAGVEELGPCSFANFVTDVVVKAPGGSTGIACGADGCPVLAAVGYRAGAAPYVDGTPQSPGNGLYRSESGLPGSFSRVGTPAVNPLLPIGFTPDARIGRIELGNAVGADQNHDIVYAIVEDAVLFNGGFPLLDIQADNVDTSVLCETIDIVDPSVAELCGLVLSQVPSPTTLNGLYASRDFGDTWIRLTDDANLLANGVQAGSSLIAAAALGVGPGIQSWYNLFIKPDPTATLAGEPIRLVFGLEEVWKNRINAPLIGVAENTPIGLDVIGTYFAGDTCLFLIGNLGDPGLPVCPNYDGLVSGTTTHPDQHDAMFIEDPERGGVWLFIGNDGGVYKQYSADPFTNDFANNRWGEGANDGFYTLMNYGIDVAKDGTVYYGLQDNASGKIDPVTREQIRIFVGDGMWTAVDPDNADIAYYQTPGLAMVRSTDGGRTNTSMGPGAASGANQFQSPFVMDPLDANHIAAAGSAVAVTTNAATDADWTTVFDLGTNPENGAANIVRTRALDVQGDAIYVGFCGPCNLVGSDRQFRSGIATNMGGTEAPQKGTAAGWRFASAQGLPNRNIYNIEIDPEDPNTVYVVLGGYSSARWAGPGQYLDSNPNLGVGSVYKSTDAGETFVNISGNLPELIATAVLRRGEQLIIGTDIGAFISSDLDGSEWAPLGDLPNVPINQLVLQPGDDRQLFAATFGRGVQTYRFAANATPPEAPPAGPIGPGLGGDESGIREGSGAWGLGLLPLLFLLGLRRRRMR
jgi:hypothetical protein